MTVLVLLLLGVVGVFGFGFVCPRCRASLLLKAVAIFRGGKFACPKCRVDMDEPTNSPTKPL
jgi:transposase-like protein